MMLGGGATALVGIAHVSPDSARRVLLLYTVPALCLAIAGLTRIWKANRQLFYLTVLVTMYFILLSAGPEAYSRFRVPITPILVLLTATGLVFILDCHHAHRAEP